MKTILRRLQTRSAMAAIMAIGVMPVAGQSYRAPRGPGGKPDLNGIWQALNEANYDIEGHDGASGAWRCDPVPMVRCRLLPCWR